MYNRLIRSLEPSFRKHNQWFRIWHVNSADGEGILEEMLKSNCVGGIKNEKNSGDLKLHRSLHVSAHLRVE